MSPNYHYTACGICGAPGHNEKSPRCPYRSSQEKMERRTKLKQRIEIASDPALREATSSTLFLGQVR